MASATRPIRGCAPTPTSIAGSPKLRSISRPFGAGYRRMIVNGASIIDSVAPRTRRHSVAMSAVRGIGNKLYNLDNRRLRPERSQRCILKRFDETLSYRVAGFLTLQLSPRYSSIDNRTAVGSICWPWIVEDFLDPMERDTLSVVVRWWERGDVVTSRRWHLADWNDLVSTSRVSHALINNFSYVWRTRTSLIDASFH